MQRFDTFAALHVAGKPVILFNVWDAGSAQAVARAGAKAIATGSVSVANAHGFGDGEKLPIALAIANAERVAAAVELPVTIDFEGAYAAEPDKAAINVALVAATGAVGCNFEDQVVGGEGLHSIRDQGRRIKAIRSTVGAKFFINARTDLFLKADRQAHTRELADAAIDRALAYADAGASGIFIPGLVDLRLIERIAKASPLPVNTMAMPGSPSTREMADAGVARISYGPVPYRRMTHWLEDAARAELS
jgi:2-methylisocitrate lyase-like PEP mutase family enzyme